MSCIEKWAMINRMIHNERIAILALQETHLDQMLLDQLIDCFGKNLDIINSPLPSNPRASAGVAFIINKALIRPKEYSLTELDPGRAIMLHLKWLETCEISIVNVYAPHNRNDQPNFWARTMTNRRTKRLPLPDFVLGDFNVTEDSIDRAPAHHDDPTATETMRDVRCEWNIQDTWRHTHPDTRCFTYHASANGTQIQSRLDRIYTAHDISQHVFDWQTKPSGVPTDHWLVKVKYAPRDAPFIGNGRWTWPLYMLGNETLMRKVDQRGIKFMADIERTLTERTDRATENPQTLWKSYKVDITKLAKDTTRTSYHKLNSQINAIEKDLQALYASPDYDSNESARTNAAFMASELEHMAKVKAKNQRNKLHAKLAHHGERLGGIWSAISKEKKPCDLILRLKVLDSSPTQYERCTKCMVKLARDFHENLQKEDSPQPLSTEEQETMLEEVLQTIPDLQHLPDPERSPLNWEASEDHIQRALKLSKDNTAAGLDGCPNELWKVLQRRFEAANKENKTGFDVVKALTILIRDIQEHGVDTRTDLAEGWMCPLYKKKDPTNIRNYRPITVLNTDYKILTKVLAVQLMDHADTLIHEDQAGFIPRRSIFNHIRLAKAIINYAEITEENGAIIALDQEKAYDHIYHDYLWKVLKAFHIPAPFIATVKSLYTHAHTQVAINSVLSQPFKVTRGVRQGDPLSCPLFNLAIEPLACMIRNNPDIHGLDIPCLTEKLVIKLFADDTNLYLSKHDHIDIVQRTLDKWCMVSGAKFNIEKTEIIPIGTVTHRLSVTTTRKINQNDQNPLPDRIRIAKDGEAVRMLGTWIGNKAEDQTPWEPVIDKVKASLKKWSKICPTIEGKGQIIQATVGGLTQFLTQTQGMPPHVVKVLNKIISDFIWDDGKGPRIALEFLQLPKDQGGLNILDLQSRNEAIDLMWLKSYLNFAPDRQPWAAISDLIIDAAAPKKTTKQARINPFLQCWNTLKSGPRFDKLNDDIKRMLKTAKDHHTNLAAVKIPLHLQRELPAWYHIDEQLAAIRTRAAKCLLNKHGVTTVADLLRVSARVRNPNETINHRPALFCPCRDCTSDRASGCYNAHKCAIEALQKLQ